MSLGRGHGRDTSTGIIIAVTGIALAMTVMMLSVAVIKGFKNEIRAKVTGFESQLTLTATSEDAGGDADNDMTTEAEPIELTTELRKIISSVVSGAEMTPTIIRPGVLKTPGSFAGIVLKAYEGGLSLRFIADHVTQGTMPDFAADSTSNDIVISRLTADRLGLAPGDKADAYFFAQDAMKARRLRIAAVYDTHFDDYDGTYAFASPAMLRRLDRMGAAQATRIDINGLTSDGAIEPAARSLQTSLLDAYYNGRVTQVYRVDNVHRRGALYFNWLALLDTNVIVILALMGAVAGFTLISSLFIIILDRVRMIGILKALGATNAMIRHTFIIVAERIVVRGLIIGNLLGLGLIALQAMTHFIPLDAETYYLSYVPVEISWTDVALLNLGVIVAAALVLILPSHIVATISPSRSIRFD